MEKKKRKKTLNNCTQHITVLHNAAIQKLKKRRNMSGRQGAVHTE